MSPPTADAAALPPSWSYRHPIVTSLLVFLAVAVAGVIVMIVLNPSGNLDHFAGHAVTALPLAVLSLLIARRWPAPPPQRLARWVRWGLIGGIAVFALGTFIEAVGAFGFDDDERLALAPLHDIGLIAGLAGMLVAMGAVAATVALAVADRRGGLTSRRTGVIVGIAVLALVLFLLGGMFFGY